MMLSRWFHCNSRTDVEKGNLETSLLSNTKEDENTESMHLKDKSIIGHIINKDLEKVQKYLEQHSKEAKRILKCDLGDDAKDFVGNNLLGVACERSSREVCEYLLGLVQDLSSVEQDDHSLTLYHCAAVNESTDILQLLKSRRGRESDYIVSRTTESGNTPLHFAALHGKNKCTKWLLDQNADINAANQNKGLPLHWAANGGHVPTFDLIYEKHVTEIEDRIKQSCASDEEFQNKIARMSKHQHVGEECLKIEANKIGVPLLFAAKGQHFELVQNILNKQREADATPRDDEGDTALHFLSMGANVEQLKGIIKANALIGAKNVVGNTPLDWISVETMQEILDSCVERRDRAKKDIDVLQKDQYEIKFRNIFGHHANGADMKNIIAIANSPKHQELALHPLCQCIVSIKWQKIRKYFFLKMLFFIAFVIQLTNYPVLLTDRNDVKTKNDTCVLEKIDNDIVFTWYTVYLLLLIQVMFGLLSVAVLISPFIKESKLYLHHFSGSRFKRLLEFYYTQLIWSHWYEYIVWVLAFLLLHEYISPVPVVICAWFSFFIVSSNHPSVLPYRYILLKIFFRYIKFLLFAFGLITGFAMGFFLLMRECKNDIGNPCGSGAFESIYTTALKVPSMMMGEISFESFVFDRTSPKIYFLFGAFIFLITCCTFNMMNGLAINITQEMMLKAHIFKTIAECEMIYEFELLLSEVSRWLKWFKISKVKFLSPLWVEIIKASPSSGKCENLDEFTKSEHKKLKEQCGNCRRCNACRYEKEKINMGTFWLWVDRGYKLDRNIIYNAYAICAKRSTNSNLNTVDGI